MLEVAGLSAALAVLRDADLFSASARAFLKSFVPPHKKFHQNDINTPTLVSKHHDIQAAAASKLGVRNFQPLSNPEAPCVNLLFSRWPLFGRQTHL